MRNILIFLLASFLCLQCKNECIDENIKLGDISFNEVTSDHLEYYQDKQTVSFMSNTGDIRVHEIQLIESTDPILCVKVICRPSYELEGLNGCEYYDVEDRQYILSSDELDISIKAEMKLFKVDTEDYYESIDVGLTSADTTFNAGHVTITNFDNSPNINRAVFPEFFRVTPNSPYSNYDRVLEYTSDDGNTFIIYKKDRGVVNYRIDNVVWTLVE